MSVLEKLMKIRQNFIDRDRQQAMEILTEMLHYKVAPRVTAGDSFPLFKDESAVAAFCQNNSLDCRALSWLLASMREERLLAPGTTPVTLTPLGVEKIL